MPYVMPTFRSMVRTPWLDLRLKNVPDRWFEIRGVLHAAIFCVATSETLHGYESENPEWSFLQNPLPRSPPMNNPQVTRRVL
jgi:hypothetical protein